MNAERSSGLLRRAAVHHALGDQGRLAIVDALLLGDTSPSALQAQLGMASNLLAHHLRVLDDAGVLRRARSEGDRRRSYLTLVPGALDDLSSTAAISAPRVVFVCTENAARSQLAAAMWAYRSTVPAASAGTRPARRIHPGTLDAAARHDVPLEPQTPRSLDRVVRSDDLVITVCDRAHEELPAEMAHRHWSVADPAAPATDSAMEQAFDRAVDELGGRIAQLAPAVHPPPARSA